MNDKTLEEKDDKFKRFAERHGGVSRIRDTDDYTGNKGHWTHLKTYIMDDGANWYELTDYPETDMGLRFEYWSSDDPSVVMYV